MTKLLTPQEAADYLRVKVSFIYERTRNNAIPLRRVGKFIRIPQDELIAWLDEQTGPLHTSRGACPAKLWLSGAVTWRWQLRSLNLVLSAARTLGMLNGSRHATRLR